jgi:hypothetical protein
MPSRSDRVEVGRGRLDPGEDRVGVREQHLAGVGQLDRTGPAGADDELLSDDALERRDLLADRRLHVTEPGGGAPERALLGHRREGGQVPDLDAGGVIYGHGHPQPSRSVF